LVNRYYDLATDLYERGWGQSFHFAPRKSGETLKASIGRHEQYVASLLRLRPGMQVLDVGCGVGGPMRRMAHVSGADITGINNNANQLERAARYNLEYGLSRRCHLVKADFMRVSLPCASFDAAYEFDALVHAPDFGQAVAGIYRLLRPGGCFVLSDWCLTDRFDPDNPEHQSIKKGIEEGNGLPDLPTSKSVVHALEQAGFEIVLARDLGQTADGGIPWYRPISAREPGMAGLRLSRGGRLLSKMIATSMEWLGLAPKGASRVHDLLLVAADSLVKGAELGIFTPLHVVHARKPS
jgi:sterol 24-C-methyltransferase